ncbi:hypothetical protein AEAC466_04325 [Asticcacaulis sp. AC466]|uniref:hypothetical protein n=1 Tax=Asticcacaulis sp. AC466 TaxID=1282362 RepID=UPI0003C4082E|nr:hypothetical protein [Asticcacaulis sp. AC466]ESQ85397.1 hypothetical protein AEAC466_04325 [Asticcacaulis sp. AC466]
MSAESDFLRPMPEQALRESELVAVRTLSGHVETLGTQIESLRIDMREVRDKVITFEAAKMEAQITGVRAEVQALAIKVATLELQRATSVGAKSLRTEFREWLPTLAMLGAALLFWFKHS